MKPRIPHTYVLLFSLILLAALTTWLVPAGEYERMERDGRAVVVAGSYRVVGGRPAGLAEVLLAVPRGLIQVADIVFYIFIVGGAFGVLAATGAIDGGIGWFLSRAGSRQSLVVPLLTLLFALGGGSFGMAEETLPFLPALVLLTRRLGYDSLTAGGVALAGSCAGFAGAFLNPFTIGVAQGIVGLPLFSGIAFRLGVWVLVTTVTIVWMARYAARVRRRPELSPVFELDRARGEPAAGDQTGPLSTGHLRVLAAGSLALVLLAVGAMRWGWGILELSGLFIALAAVAGPLGGLTPSLTAARFVDGAAALTGGALVVGVARGTLVILSDAGTIDTITQSLVAAVQALPVSISVLGIYCMQAALNFLVPSASGQAAISMPVLSPLSDLLGVTRQTLVLAYQFGDGFTNVWTPTQGYFMAGLGILGIPWSIWARWILPLLCLWTAIGMAALLVAHAIRLGPF